MTATAQSFEGATPTAAASAQASEATRFAVGLFALCAAYLALEAFYVFRLPLVMDEFQGAAMLDKLSTGLPYRDFRPYKSVLGYYVQLAPFALATGAFGKLIAVKLTMASLTSLGLFWAGLRLAKCYRADSVLLGIALLVCMSSFLERSAALRVDMLTALVGLASLIALLEGRALRAGALAGASFLISQKGIYFAAAGGIAVLAPFAVARDREARGAVLRAALVFGAAALAPVLVYLACFALAASKAVVSEAVFAQAVDIARYDGYEIHAFWWQTLRRNPWFYLLTPVALLHLTVLARDEERSAQERSRAVRLLAYGLVLLVLCLLHRQPWPYFFVFWAPTGAVLAIALLERAATAPQRVRQGVLAATLVLGLALPLLARLPSVLARDSGFQRHMIELSERVLAPDETYFAGLNFVPTRSHAALRGLTWIDSRQLRKLEALPAAELQRRAREIVTERPKLVIWSHRIAKLPTPLLETVQARYAPLFGNVFIYSPALDPGEGSLQLDFSGRYALSGPPGSELEIAGRRLLPGEEVRLAVGRVAFVAAAGQRLHLVPDGIESMVDGRYAKPRPLFDAAYTY